jgi:hypothetical protein
VPPVWGPPTLPSACRINKPIDPSFFFVVGIILKRIDDLAQAQIGAGDVQGE